MEQHYQLQSDNKSCQIEIKLKVEIAVLISIKINLMVYKCTIL
jgi:hypothetical protein